MREITTWCVGQSAERSRCFDKYCSRSWTPREQSGPTGRDMTHQPSLFRLMASAGMFAFHSDTIAQSLPESTFAAHQFAILPPCVLSASRGRSSARASSRPIPTPLDWKNNCLNNSSTIYKGITRYGHGVTQKSQQPVFFTSPRRAFDRGLLSPTCINPKDVSTFMPSISVLHHPINAFLARLCRPLALL
jgi:hypothetical protein